MVGPLTYMLDSDNLTGCLLNAFVDYSEAATYNWSINCSMAHFDGRVQPILTAQLLQDLVVTCNSFVRHVVEIVVVMHFCFVYKGATAGLRNGATTMNGAFVHDGSKGAEGNGVCRQQKEKRTVTERSDSSSSSCGVGNAPVISDKLICSTGSGWLLGQFQMN